MGAQDDTRFNARIFLLAVMPIGYEYDPEEYKSHIRLADEAHPWATYYQNDTLAPSIYWMSDVEIREGHGIDRHYTVKIRPPFLLRREQLYAYEQYGDRLARSLAHRVPKEVIKVSSRIELNGTYSQGYRPRDI